MKRILIVGSGDVALRAIPLLTRRYRVFALVRNPANCARLRGMGVMPVLGDLDDRASLARIAGLADVVLHFAPPPSEEKSPLRPPLHPQGVRRGVPDASGITLSQAKWGTHSEGEFVNSPPFAPARGTPMGARCLQHHPLAAKGGQEGELARGRAFADTRTRNLLSALSRACPEQGRRSKPPKRLVYISTSGVYGDCSGAWVSESRPLISTSPRSLRRVNAEQQIRNWAKRNRVNASILRVPGIYAADRLPLSRLQQGTPAIMDSEDSYTNHIHADDLARISVAALRFGKPCRVYHASDDSRLMMGEYFDLVADAFGMPRVPRISRAEAQRVLPEMLLSFMNESRRLTNRRMKRELKVKLRYPTVADLLSEIKP